MEFRPGSRWFTVHRVDIPPKVHHDDESLMPNLVQLALDKVIGEAAKQVPASLQGRVTYHISVDANTVRASAHHDGLLGRRQ
jgi:hypothetical protein